MRAPAGSIAFEHPRPCQPDRDARTGWDTFHGHVAALAVARHENIRAGAKVMQVKVEDGHFVVVTT